MAAPSQKMLWTMQEPRLTSQHSFIDAKPLALSESVSVANSLNGHRNCLTRAAGFGSVPFLPPELDPHRKETEPEATDTDAKSDQAQTKSDSHKQATSTATRKHGPRNLLSKIQD